MFQNIYNLWWVYRDDWTSVTGVIQCTYTSVLYIVMQISNRVHSSKAVFVLFLASFWRTEDLFPIIENTFMGQRNHIVGSPNRRGGGEGRGKNRTSKPFPCNLFHVWVKYKLHWHKASPHITEVHMPGT